jgi:hypothetical protein
MKIKQLLEFVDEDFKQMSQQATNIRQGKGNATDAQLRQQRIQQLAANQNIRNAFPAGKPMNAPVVPTTLGAPTAVKTQQAAQTATTPAAKPGISWAGVGKGISRVGNALKTGIKGAADLGSQAVGGAAQAALSGVGGAVRGYKTAKSGGKFGSAGWDTGAASPAASSTNAAGDQELAQLKSQLQAMDQRLQKAGIAERKS